MAKMFEALKLIYSGKDIINRQICLFSVCGTAGLINGYLALAHRNINELTQLYKVFFALLILLFSLFFIGYETMFLHTRELPDINFETFMIALKKVPFMIFLIYIPVILTSIFTKYQYLAFCTETILSIPLTMLQGGFSYNFENTEAIKFFKKFTVKDYFLLLIKRIWIVLSAYAVTLSAVFLLFFIAGIVIAIYYHGDISTISFTISASQFAISKLANYITAILLLYTTSIGILIWNYELIKTYEN